jgi:hypothetical protein
MSEERKKYVTETAEGLKYHLKLGMDNLSAKMAATRFYFYLLYSPVIPKVCSADRWRCARLA